VFVGGGWVLRAASSAMEADVQEAHWEGLMASMLVGRERGEMEHCVLFFKFYFIVFTFAYMCIHCFNPPLPLPLPHRLWAEPVPCSCSPILLKKKHKIKGKTAILLV
jgi:hypothetical protein